MGRSLKKGPFIDDHLMDKVTDMNERNERKVVERGISPRLSWWCSAPPVIQKASKAPPAPVIQKPPSPPPPIRR